MRLRREAGVRRSGPGPERTVNGREVPGRRREAKPLGTEAWGGDAAASEPRGGQLDGQDRLQPGPQPPGAELLRGQKPPATAPPGSGPGPAPAPAEREPGTRGATRNRSVLRCVSA